MVITESSTLVGVSMVTFEIEAELITSKRHRPKRYIVESVCVRCGKISRSIHNLVALAAESWSFYQNHPHCKECYSPKKGRK